MKNVRSEKGTACLQGDNGEDESQDDANGEVIGALGGDVVARDKVWPRNLGVEELRENRLRGSAGHDQGTDGDLALDVATDGRGGHGDDGLC